VLAALLAGCGSSTGTPRLTFGYETSAPLGYVDRGRINRPAYPIAIHDVSFRSGSLQIDGFLLVPPGKERRPGVVFVHGSGGDRSELLAQAAWLAARNVVTLTITEPSTSSPPAQAATEAAFVRQVGDVQVRDVVTVRRAVDVLQSLPMVDPQRIGYLGWSAGAKTGAFLAASDRRVKALVLLSAGAAPLAEFVANAQPTLRSSVREILGSVDPIRYIALARPGSVLLEDGTKDEIVPHAALVNIVHAAPRGTTVRWYDAPHALDSAAYRDAFGWLTHRLTRRS
jgi:dienelactone hydrolase